MPSVNRGPSPGEFSASLLYLDRQRLVAWIRTVTALQDVDSILEKLDLSAGGLKSSSFLTQAERLVDDDLPFEGLRKRTHVFLHQCAHLVSYTPRHDLMIGLDGECKAVARRVRVFRRKGDSIRVGKDFDKSHRVGSCSVVSCVF